MPRPGIEALRFNPSKAGPRDENGEDSESPRTWTLSESLDDMNWVKNACAPVSKGKVSNCSVSFDQ